MWTYKQTTGDLSHNDKHEATGYSGFGFGKNNHALQSIHNAGPLPVGLYDIGPIHDTDTHGPCVMRLTPCAGTNTYGRDGFLIHGDSKLHPGTASQGCIILPLTARLQIADSGDSKLQVIE